jgi:Zn-dependent peptidase ImmA (M78 family)
VSKSSGLSWREARERGYGANELLAHFSITRPPVPVEDIARSLGAIVTVTEKGTDPGWAGAVQLDPEGNAHIWLDGNDHYRRRRFTLAHELGHLLLHPMELLRRAYRDNARFTGGDDEIAANKFAADLLVPLWMLAPEDAFVYDVQDLSRMFEASPAVISIRLAQTLVR